MYCFNKSLPVIKRHPETRELAELLEREQQIIDLITTCANRLQGMVDDYWWLDRGYILRADGFGLSLLSECYWPNPFF